MVGFWSLDVSTRANRHGNLCTKQSDPIFFNSVSNFVTFDPPIPPPPGWLQCHWPDKRTNGVKTNTIRINWGDDEPPTWDRAECPYLNSSSGVMVESVQKMRPPTVHPALETVQTIFTLEYPRPNLLIRKQFYIYIHNIYIFYSLTEIHF